MIYDVIILGAGPGGYVAAIKAAQMGGRVALIEKEDIGGVCLNWGCIPTKALLKSARLYEEIKKSDFFGIDGIDKDKIRVNWEQMNTRKDVVVKRLVNGVTNLLKKNGVEVFQGIGKLQDKNTVVVGGQILKGKNLIIATGSRAVMPSIEGIEEAAKAGIAITSKEALGLKDLPAEVVILGGGVIAVEFATLFNALGSKVTLVQRSARILTNVEEELAEGLQRHLIDKGIDIITNSQIKRVQGKSVVLEVMGKEKICYGDKILVSLGRKPNTDGLEVLGLEMDKNGIRTNEKLETNIPGVYAIGDVNGKYQLAHLASAEGITAVENIFGQESKINYEIVPSCIYSFPEIATVGLTEQDARKQGYDVTISKFPLSANGKALAEGESIGFVKIVAEKQYGEILGVHIMAVHATDMISEAIVSMQMEGTVYDVAQAIHPHPTLSEIMMEAAHGAIHKPIHH
ncbi:dihydrolipoyl dehydrogenase [Geosporobacter ferrireducens]|uniref:Dihydrolipoyl dehydrogenase n=1 Tax=Geosporobacter ferrireducens TaxID=1424294 RepID=A0A1D8GJP0_9FIRM|nr:dihydrolipoyl dehydrogenase [Geosporobacter ferrireducens]AOT71042.1 dihydrolipoyl dehydrogenase [Geosporobacter ferrireducens]MTI58265.1 dihydrolipoyl dehydrogenase [Geosporobacter ferrireducens]